MQNYAIAVIIDGYEIDIEKLYIHSIMKMINTKFRIQVM